MSYAAAIDQLSAMTPELYSQPGHARRKFSLAEIALLLDALGNPHRRFPSVLIAGTNGKGSTAATLASILRESGVRCSLYTSPHLTRPNERIRVAGGEISDEEFARLYFRVHDCGQRLTLDGRLAQLPSFFETLTAMAFLHFAESAVEFAVLEVGMGGRLDATNIVDPLLSIVTDISLDHMEWLGPTISAITREKAGILRAGGTLITLPQHPEANQVLGEIATELDVRAVSAVAYMPQAASRATAPSAELTDASAYPVEVLGALIHVASPLHGDHQHRNVALAIAAAVELATRHGLPITPSAIEQGVRNTQWPGRLEAIRVPSQGSAAAQAPPGSSARSDQFAPMQWVLDVAHNPAGAWALRAALRSLFCLGEPHAPPATLIFACLRDKPLAEMAQILFPLFDEVIFAPIHSARATPVADLLAAAEDVGTPARAASSVAEALEFATAAPVARKSVVRAASTGTVPIANEAAWREAQSALRVVAGSVYLVGEVRPLLLARIQAS
jgi:dihydrofolate synthase/folylpolyglutamate synthase